MPDLLSDLADYQAKDPQQALDDAVATVQSYCGWHITPSISESVTVWSSTGRAVYLPTMHLTAVSAVTQNALTVAPATYTFEPHGVISRTYGAYFSPLTRVTVAFTHGYAEWPDEVRGVILALAQRSISDTRGMVSRVGGGQSVVALENYGPQLGEADKSKLAPYVIFPPIGA